MVVTVAAVNDELFVKADSAATGTGSVSVPVLANDGDVDGDLDPASQAMIGGPVHGTAEVTGTSISYVSSPDFVGEDSFVYEVCDSSNACGTGVVSITVSPLRSPARRHQPRWRSRSQPIPLQWRRRVRRRCSSAEAR